MDRDFQSLFNTDVSFPADDPYTIYSGLSFQSLLSINEEKTLLPLLDYACGTTSSPITDSPATFGFFGNDFTPIRDNHKPAHRDVQKLNSIDFMSDVNLKMPKHESLNNDFEFNQVSAEPFDFFSEISHLPSEYSSSCFLQLPELRSIENVVQNESDPVAESSRKRVKSLSPPSDDPYSLESIYVRNFQMSKLFASPGVQANNDQGTVRRTSLASQRNQKFSEKTRCLQKVLPCDKKMDMETMLEEAYKYVKILRAQVSILKAMPHYSSSPNGFLTGNPSNVYVFGGGLGRLNRNRLLQVLVNSPVAQTIMYSQGLCAFSIEQLALLKEIIAGFFSTYCFSFESSLMGYSLSFFSLLPFLLFCYTCIARATFSL